MAKDKVQKVLEDDELEIDEVEETEDAESVEVFSAKAVATMLGTDGRSLRKFLRKEYGRVGQGNRWEIEADKIDDIRKGFEAFNKPKPSEAKVLLAPADVELDDFDDLVDDEALEIEDLDGIAID
jgi:hypothetical protein